MPWCFGTSGFGAREQHAAVAPLRGGVPHLLARDDEVVAVAHRAAAEARKVGAGAGLAEELAPRVLAGEQAGHELTLLRFGAEGHERRAEHGDRRGG